jgi:hypothetical protein
MVTDVLGAMAGRKLAPLSTLSRGMWHTSAGDLAFTTSNRYYRHGGKLLA